MEATVPEAAAVERGGVASTPTTPLLQSRKNQKRRRRSSGGAWEGRRTSKRSKKSKTEVSSTHAANNIMKFRLGGSVSDPLNLLGGDDLGDTCSTCTPSPATPIYKELEVPDLPPQLMKDPLNLEEKVKNFPQSVIGSKAKGSGSGKSSGPSSAGARKKPRRRTTSGSKPDSTIGSMEFKKNSAKSAKFRYGNYNRYYSYRNEGGSGTVDSRMCLLRKEWFQNKRCLDIGCNTGQVTIAIAKEFKPCHILGVDIDHGLVRTAWKNLNREHVVSLTPEGLPFPCSLTMSHGMLTFPPTSVAGFQSLRPVAGKSMQNDYPDNSFPSNITFKHENYVPASDSPLLSGCGQYDVILALSLTKWVHLNWGDVGMKRLFKKVFAQLRPGGRFIMEPQPFTSYAKRKKLTESIFQNYQKISFFPEDFHQYLMSSEIGFSHHLYIGTSSNKAKGFQRPLHVYTKTTPSLSSDSSSCETHLLEQPRMKSVVIVCSKQENFSHNEPHPPPTSPSSGPVEPHPSPISSAAVEPHPPPISSGHVKPHPSSISTSSGPVEPLPPPDSSQIIQLPSTMISSCNSVPAPNHKSCEPLPSSDVPGPDNPRLVTASTDEDQSHSHGDCGAKDSDNT